jgi:large subunit ribosomal protein L18
VKTTELKQTRSKRRRLSVRRRIRRSGPKVRLSVFRSSKHIYAQLVDDASGASLGGVGTAARGIQADLAGKNKTDRASFIGKEIAKIAQEKGVEAVVFDRGPFAYHGRVKALADGAREGGLRF